MDELYDQDILCSIKSEDSNQSNQKQQKSNQNKQKVKDKNQGNNYYRNTNQFEQQIQIRETIDFGYQYYQDKIHAQLKKQNNNKNKIAQKQKSDSSDFGDTDQIINYVDKNKKYNLQIQTQPTTKPHSHKNPNNPSQKILHSQKTTHHYEYPKTVNHFQQQKPKIIQNYYQHQYDINTSTQQQQLDLIYMSIIGQRNKQKPGNLSNKKQQITKQPTTSNNSNNSNNSNKNIKQNKEQQTFQYNKSIYLNSNKKQPQIKAGIGFKLMDNTMYWVFQDKSIKISSGTLQGLVQQFFKRQSMLPLISDSQYKAQHIANYMEVYTKFLNDFFPVQFKQIFNILSLQGTKSTFTNPVTPKSSQNTMLKNLFNSYMPKFLQNLSYSKSSLLCDHMIKKLNLLKTIQKLKKQKQQDNIPFTQKIKQIYYEIAILQLLVSFENSSSYCKNNSKQGIDHRIWKQHGKKITQLRGKFIEKIENQQNDYSFII